jgi:hypothetical protein
MGERVRWQYRVVSIGSFFAGDRLGGALGRLGEDGWELVTVYDKASNWLQGMEKGFMLFKRPVLPGEEPEGRWAEVWDAARTEAEVDPKFKPGETPWA